MTCYLDSSVLLGILFGEAGSRPPVAEGEGRVSSRLVEVETFRALDRERLLGHLDDDQTAVKSKELTDLLEAVDLAPVSDEVLALARATFPVNVRSLDALHVATAQVLAAALGPVVFWTHDARQARAALARGLEVRGVAGEVGRPEPGAAPPAATTGRRATSRRASAGRRPAPARPPR